MKNLRYALLLIVGAGLVATLASMGLATRSATGGSDPNGPPVSPEIRQMLSNELMAVLPEILEAMSGQTGDK